MQVLWNLIVASVVKAALAFRHIVWAKPTAHWLMPLPVTRHFLIRYHRYTHVYNKLRGTVFESNQLNLLFAATTPRHTRCANNINISRPPAVYNIERLLYSSCHVSNIYRIRIYDIIYLFIIKCVWSTLLQCNSSVSILYERKCLNYLRKTVQLK